jgi:ferritin-like metal-binding protein YciE
MATTTSKKSSGKTAAKKKSAPQKKQNNSAQAEELKDLFEDLLKDILGAEKMILKALPKMIEGATSEELKSAFEEHLEVTEAQVERLEQVFESCGLKVASKKCKAMEGLVEEGNEAMEETEEGSLLRDVALIIAAQKIEHYEMAAYGSVRTLATIMGEEEAASLLQETLDEEGDADQVLTEIAEGINPAAYEEGEEA